MKTACSEDAGQLAEVGEDGDHVVLPSLSSFLVPKAFFSPTLPYFISLGYNSQKTKNSE